MSTKKPEGWKDKELPEDSRVDPDDKDADAARSLRNPISTKDEPRVNETPGAPTKRDPHREPIQKT